MDAQHTQAVDPDVGAPVVRQTHRKQKGYVPRRLLLYFVEGTAPDLVVLRKQFVVLTNADFLYWMTQKTIAINIDEDGTLDREWNIGGWEGEKYLTTKILTAGQPA